MANKEDFNNGNPIRCSFCGKTQDQVRRLVAGPNAYICNECILLCQEIVSDDVDTVNSCGEIEIKTPQEIKDVLDAMNCTRIVVAHRLSTVRDCDRILLLDDGIISQEGTYEELMASNELFREMVMCQSL
jgi:ABC-type glutathione transport system ATPase component